MLNYGFFALAATALLMSATSHAAPPAKKITEVEGISEYRLANGLQVLLFPDQTKETVTVNITYRVGSKHENYGETGMAHLLEHLLFKGSKNHPNIPKELSDHGSRPNGSTWTDRTNYFETFSATEKNIDWALSLEADRMVHSFIAKKDLDSEMTVVRNELEAGENSPFGVTLQRMMAAAYSWHNYGKDTIGARSDLENVPINRLQDFYRKYYQPDNATLVVAGRFSLDDMLNKVQKTFGAIAKPQRTLPSLYTEEPAQDGERSVTVRRVGDVQLFASMYHVPAGSHPDFAAVIVLNDILSEDGTGRMHKSLVESKLASRAFGFPFEWQEPGLAIFAAEVDKNKDLNQVATTLLKTVEDFKSAKISQVEVDRARRSYLKNFDLAFNSSERIAKSLSEWIGMGDWRLQFLTRDRVEKVTTADVQRVAETYLTRNNRTTGSFIPAATPQRVEIPKVTNLASMLQGYKGREQLAQGEVFDPTPDNIDARTKYFKLPNGNQVALVAKKTRGESVEVQIQVGLGDQNSLKGLQAVGEATGAMLMRGTKTRSRIELSDEFDRLKTNVAISGDATEAVARLTTTKANLVEALKLTAEVLKSPRFDENEFEQYKATEKVDLEQKLQDPQSLAFNGLMRQLTPVAKGHPSYVPTFDESLQELEDVSLDDAEDFHKEFYGSQSLRMAMIGDIDEPAVLKVLAEQFGNWTPAAKYTRVAMPYQKINAVNEQYKTPDKENATMVAGLSIAIGENHPDAPALELGNYMFGGGFLNSRLATRLRQKDGLSYGAGSFLRADSFDDRTTLGVYAICAPQNLTKVVAGFKEEMARLLKDGFTAEEVASAKSGLLQKERVSRAQDRELITTLVGNLEKGRSMKWSKDFEAQLAALTPQEVHQAMKKYINLADFSVFTAGDLDKVSQKKTKESDKI